MDIERATYFSIKTADRSGELARFTKRMSEHGVNLGGVWAFGVGRGSAEIIAIPRDVPAFKRALLGAGWVVQEGACFHLSGDDRAGALADTLDRIAQEDVNLQAVDAMGISGRYSAYVWCEEKDMEKLRKILKGW